MELKSKGAAAIIFKPFSQEDLRKVFERIRPVAMP